VYKFLAGYEFADASGQTHVVTGKYDLFSNFDLQSRTSKSKPPTLIIDSDALENSGQIDESFRPIFAPEIEQFRREYAIRHGQVAAEAVGEAQILREVVNTVGKRNALGSHIRCVVSVSMLTEGWDCSTVTHIVGLRPFMSQLLCEQVVGRGLRRRSYHADDEVRFTEEVARVFGVPFEVIPFKETGVTPPVKKERHRVYAVEEKRKFEITFPR